MPDGNCPKCGAALERMKKGNYTGLPAAVYACGTVQSQFATMCRCGPMPAAPSKDEQIASLTQQLADARLLARAALTLGVFVFPGGIKVLVDRATSAMQFYEVQFDEHGLPILTDELRAALQKVIGET